MEPLSVMEFARSLSALLPERPTWPGVRLAISARSSRNTTTMCHWAVGGNVRQKARRRPGFPARRKALRATPHERLA